MSTRWWQAAGITEKRIQEIADWGARIIRLPINQDWVLNGVAPLNRGVEYLKDIDQIVDWAAAAGMYVLLDLQVLDRRTKGRPLNWTQPMPDDLSLLFWRILASRYRSDPAVLYDLCNEPHKPGEDDWATYKGCQPPEDSGWIKFWHEWVRQLEGVIHQTHWDAVIFVSGIGGPCYAASLRRMPVPIPPYVKNPRHVPNAVYSCHIYRKAHDDGDGVDDSSGNKMGTDSPEHWSYWFAIEWVRGKHPIFLGEFGAQPRDFDPKFANVPNPSEAQQAINEKAINEMRKWGENLLEYLRKLSRRTEDGQWPGLAGWTAWSWGDEPQLVRRAPSESNTKQDRPYQMDPDNPKVHAVTDFGALVKAELGLHKPKGSRTTPQL